MERGYIKLWRRLSDSDFWLSGKFDKQRAWVDLLMLANHKDNHFWCRGIRIDVERGQVGYSMDALSKRWKWSRKKVKTFLEYLKTEHQIEHQIDKVTTLITISNYETYQEKRTAKSTSKAHQKHIKSTLTINDKNDKKNKHIDCVYLTDEEYSKLEQKFNSGLEARIRDLNDYKMSKGKKYKSDYHTILTWSRKDGSDGNTGKATAKPGKYDGIGIKAS